MSNKRAATAAVLFTAQVKMLDAAWMVVQCRQKQEIHPDVSQVSWFNT